MYYFPNPYMANPYYQAGVRFVPAPNLPAPYYESYPSPYEYNYPFERQFPPVDTQQLDVSVRRFQDLIKQADLLIDRLAHSKEFATELMSSAQQSNKERVNQLIRSTGVSIKVETTFTPTGIRIVLDNSKVDGECCKLMIALRW